MSCFRELYARFPSELYAICLEEAFAENRPVYEFENDELGPAGILCDYCVRPARFEWGPTLGRYQGRDATCGDDLCNRLHEWIEAPTKDGGYKRRRLFKELFGRYVVALPREMRREAVLTAMLKYEALERVNGTRKPRLRVAA